MTFEEYPMGKDKCPDCGHILDAATRMTSAGRPEPGDVTVCFYCSAFLRWNKDMRLAPLTAAEMRLMPEPQRSLLHKMRQHLHKR